MTNYPDEMLMAYADGELPAEEARELEASLGADPALRQRLEPYMTTGVSLAALFDQPLREPVPERLLATVRAAATATRPAPMQARRRPRMTSFFSAMSAALFPDGLSPAGVAAAGALLLIGCVAGVIATRLASPEATAALVAADANGHLIASGLLKRALATVPSEISSGTGATVVTPVKTFRDREHHLCRQYEVDDNGTHLAGIACRDNDGAWQIALHSERVTAKPGPGSYETAGPAEQPAVKAAVEAMIAGDPLSPEDEQAVLSQSSKN